MCGLRQCVDCDNVLIGPICPMQCKLNAKFTRPITKLSKSSNIAGLASHEYHGRGRITVITRQRGSPSPLLPLCEDSGEHPLLAEMVFSNRFLGQ